MQTHRIEVIGFFLVLICGPPAFGGALFRTHKVACAPTRPGLCAALTENGEVLVTEDLGGRWNDPVRLPSFGTPRTAQTLDSETEETEESFEPGIAVCDCGTWLAVRGNRALIGDSKRKTWGDVSGLLPSESPIGRMPPVCDGENRLWVFSRDEIFVLSFRGGHARVAARFAISVTGTAVFDPVFRRVLVPTSSGVLWIEAGEHLGRSGVLQTRPLVPIAMEPGSGRLHGVWSGRLWRSNGSKLEDLGRVPGAVSALVVDRSGRIWCLKDKRTWWRLRDRELIPTNAEALAVDATGRVFKLPDVPEGHLPAAALTGTAVPSPGPLLDDLGPPPCPPRGGFRVYLSLWGNLRQNYRADGPPQPSVLGSFRNGGAVFGLSIGLEAAPHEPGACKRRLESWSRKRQRRILDQGRLLEALLLSRYRSARTDDPYKAALARLESKRIEHLLAVVERGTLIEEAPTPTGER